MAADGSASVLFSGHDPAPTVSLDSLTKDGDYTPVQQDQMDLASMVDCAFSMADWSTNHGATPSASYASPRSVPTSSPATALDAVDSTTAELRALDSMYTALSSLGLQDQSFRLNQVDSSVGSVHASPHGVHTSPGSTNPEDSHSLPMQSPLSCPVSRECGDDMNGMVPPPRSPHAVPWQTEESNQSMAAARSALIEMQNQGLSYQNIEDLVQNIQNLLNCLREKQNVQNAMNKVPMDDRLRHVVMQMIQGGNQHMTPELAALSALAAGQQFPGGMPPRGESPASASGGPFQPPFSPMGAPTSHGPMTPDASPLPSIHTRSMHEGSRTGVHSMQGMGTPTHPHGAHDEGLYPFASQNMPSSHSRSLQPEFFPPPSPHMAFPPQGMTPRAGAHRSPRPIQSIHAPSPHTPSPHTPHTPRTPRVAPGQPGSRTRGLNLPAPQTPTTPRDRPSDGHADRLPTTPTQRPFKAASLQGALTFDCKASSEPLPAPGSARGGTGVFIPGLHPQRGRGQNNSVAGSGSGNPGMDPGYSAPLSGGGRSGKNGAPLSAPLSDIQYAGGYDCDQQISPDSLSASAELSRVRCAAFTDARGQDKVDREYAPNPVMPAMHVPLDDGHSGGSLSIMNPPAYSCPIEPPAYSGSFFTQVRPGSRPAVSSFPDLTLHLDQTALTEQRTLKTAARAELCPVHLISSEYVELRSSRESLHRLQELPEEEESRDLSGSGPFRHMTCHSYAGGEVMRTLFSNDTSRRPKDPTPGDAPSPVNGPARMLPGMRQGTSAPIMESPSAEADDRCSISASLSPDSVSTDNFHLLPQNNHNNTQRRTSPQESLADALGHLSIPGDGSYSAEKGRQAASPFHAQTTPQTVPISGPSPATVGAGSVSPALCTPTPTGPSPPRYRRAISDRGSRGPAPGSLAGGGMPRSVGISNSSQPMTPPPPRSNNTAGMYPPPSALTPSRFDRMMPAGECVPLNVTHWSQDHSSVTIFLQLERFNPASLMVQIQQHMVVVMALNTEGPSHVFMMRPEHAVRVQGSKSRPQPGNGIQIVLQKRSPGNLWSNFGIVSTPQS